MFNFLDLILDYKANNKKFKETFLNTGIEKVKLK